MTDAQTQDKDRWKYRRAAVFATMAFVAAAIVYIIGWGADTALLREVSSMLIMLAGAVIMTYIGGAVADDFLQRKA